MRYLESYFRDLNVALRGFRRSPGFTAVAILTFALGVGANTTIFSVVSGVLLRPLPFRDPDRLVELKEVQPWSAMGPVTIRDMVEWRNHSTSLDGIAGYYRTSRNLRDAAEPEQIQGMFCERELFQVLGAIPMAGQTFRDDDPEKTVVISASFWRRRLGADPSAIGRQILLDGEAFDIIGILPDSFQFLFRRPAVDLWLPRTLPANSNSRMDRVIARGEPRKLRTARRSAQDGGACSGSFSPRVFCFPSPAALPDC